MKRIILLFFALACIGSTASSQAGTMDQVRNPQSPDAAGLGKYVDMPVGYYNGIPDISVPLYQLDAKGVKVPVSLSYHAGGLKIQELPGSVGAGFSLNAGGVITRIVRGYPDYDAEQGIKQKVAIWDFYPWEEWDIALSTPGVEVVGPTADIFSYDPVIRDPCEHVMTRMDTEIDQYYYNFLGHTGKFTLSNDGYPVLLSEEDLKIEYSSGAFTITDGQGMVYYFGSMETQYDDPNYGPYYTSAWYLTSITMPDHNKTVSFTYSSYDNMYSGLYPHWGDGEFYTAFQNQVYSVEYESDGPGGGGTGDSYGEIPTAGSSIRSSNPFGPGTTLFIDEIKYDSTKIKFYGGLTRTDMYKYALDSIVVSNNAAPIKKVQFHYGYFNADSAWYWKKLKLDSLSMNDQVYRFGYIGPYGGKTLPPIYSRSRDLWGYYNGWDQPDSFPPFKLLESKGYDPGDQLFNFWNVYIGTGINRCPNDNYAQIGTLSSIQYPTGGKTFFEYEGNDFTACSFTSNIETDSKTQFKFHPAWKLSTNVYKAGGLRIKKMRFEPNPGEGSVLEKTYSYRNLAADSSTGVLESPIGNMSQSVKYGTPGHFQGYSGDYGWWHLEAFYLDLCGEPIIPLGNSKGGVIGYAMVTETRQDGAKTVYHFTNGTQLGKCDDYIEAGGYGAATRIRVSSDRSWLRGLPEQVDYYNSDNALVKRDFTQYTCNGDYTDPPSLSVFFSNVKFQAYYAEGNYDPINYSCYSAGYTAINNLIEASYERLYKVLDSSVQYMPGVNITEATRYAYHDIFSSPVHNYPVTITTTNSRGASIITNLKYPQDYGDLSGSSPDISKGVQNLLIKHVLANPVEKFVQRKDANGSNLRTISGGFTEYNSTLFVKPFPKLGYRLQTATGLTDYDDANIATGSASIDARYQPAIHFYGYDENGNLSESYKTNNIKESYIWDYTRQFPVAIVSKADTTSVAYTSFEASGKGYWSFSGSTSSDATAPTGKKCYALGGGNITRSGLSSGANYIVSYWSKNGSYTVSGSGTVVTGRTLNGWTYYEHPVTGVTTITISGSGSIDELRLYPQGALMKTFTYQPEVGLTSQCDANNDLLYYEYDSNNRLRRIRDAHQNTIKKICYNMSGQPEVCN